MKKPLYFDKEADAVKIRDLLAGKDIALIGRGQSRLYYTFNMKKVNILWINHGIHVNGDNLLKIIAAKYKSTAGHFLCVSGLHADFRKAWMKESGLTTFTFTDNKEPTYHTKGSGPAFLWYLCELIECTNQKIYMVGVDCNKWENGPVFIPGDPTPRKKSFNGETDGFHYVKRHKAEAMSRVFDLSTNTRIGYQKMTKEQMILDTNIISFPGIREAVR